MTWQIHVEPEAEAELDAAHRWYENQRLGRGHELLLEVETTNDRIAENPPLNQHSGMGLRGCKVGRFPYVITPGWQSQSMNSVHAVNVALSADVAGSRTNSGQRSQGL